MSKVVVQGRGDLPDGLGPVIGRPIPQHDQLAIRSLGAQALQPIDGVVAMGPRIGPQPHLASQGHFGVKFMITASWVSALVAVRDPRSKPFA